MDGLSDFIGRSAEMCTCLKTGMPVHELHGIAVT